VGTRSFTSAQKTGRDGIHGGDDGSEEFRAKKPNPSGRVQVGDPFSKAVAPSHVLKRCRRSDRRHSGHGAGGLTSSSCEMGSRAGNGVEIDIELVPQRETGMTPYEIMISESQERIVDRRRKGP